MQPINIDDHLKPATEYYPDGRTFHNKPVQWINNFGRLCTSPFSFGITKMASVCRRHLEPHVDGSIAPTPTEVVLRGCNFALGLVTGLLGIVPALLGFGLVALSNIGRKDFTFVHPAHPTPIAAVVTQDVQQNGLRVLSFNVSALPDIIQGINAMLPFSERYEAFVDYITTMNPAPHCICLQEFFDEESIAKLTTDKRILAKFPYIIAGAGRRTLGVNAGLAILSCLPVEAPQFRGYKQAQDEDAFAGKGVLAARLRINERDSFALFNTHLQSGHRTVDVAARASQIKGITAFEEEYAPRVQPEGSPVHILAPIVVGDLNACPVRPFNRDGDLVPDPEWHLGELHAFVAGSHNKVPVTRELQEGPQPVKEYSRDEQTRVSTVWQSHTPHTLWNANHADLWTREPKELDHMLIGAREGTEIDSEVTIDNRKQAARVLSDHLPLIGRFRARFGQEGFPGRRGDQ